MNQKEIALKMLEELRDRKEKLKKSILFLNDEIIKCDMTIRDLRITIARIDNEAKQIKTVKPVETRLQKYYRLQKELAQVNMELAKI